ncbi:uncharacterized protein LOC132304355 [Cornus florida]|uniref:uncharacterized protein LOC132304355 n=1 Tax=Cornus florida TaxID=4283 RepID=UPI00289B1DE3|nr:uncharacterized protein LOC132304355 [Cornus florida]
MNLTRSKTTCLFSLFISFFILSSYTAHDQTSTSGCSSFYAWILLLAGSFLVAALAIVALRATVVTWITVLVLLTVAGKHSRVLVSEGKKITTDVAVYLVKAVLKERGVFAVTTCATVLSLMAMAFSF